MPMRISGTFEVTLQPQEADDKEDGSTLGRLSIDKHFHGDLDARSKGQMLSALSDVQGSAGYVAVERVRGTLNGRRGSFVLQHCGTMSKQGAKMTITVVPDSGSGELVGLAASMAIRVEGGQHFYDLEYTLPDAP